MRNNSLQAFSKSKLCQIQQALSIIGEAAEKQMILPAAVDLEVFSGETFLPETAFCQ
jgi:hypothetical protein